MAGGPTWTPTYWQFEMKAGGLELELSVWGGNGRGKAGKLVTWEVHPLGLRGTSLNTLAAQADALVAVRNHARAMGRLATRLEPTAAGGE